MANPFQMAEYFQIRIDGRLQDGIYSGSYEDVKAYASYYGGYESEVIKTSVSLIKAGYAKELDFLQGEEERLKSELQRIETKILQLRKG